MRIVERENEEKKEKKREKKRKERKKKRKKERWEAKGWIKRHVSLGWIPRDVLSMH